MPEAGGPRGAAVGFERAAPSVLPGVPPGSPVSPERAGVDGPLASPGADPWALGVAVGEGCAPFPDGECAVLSCVTWTESRDDDDAVGAAGERSRYQLHPVHAGRFAAHGWDFERDARDWRRAIVIAYEVWQASGGWGPWTSAPGCR